MELKMFVNKVEITKANMMKSLKQSTKRLILLDCFKT